jgi:saccharopine dehydrogenase-like NADP-dependent oxidoreductase
MWEKTLRYPGHVEKIKMLKALGFFNEEPVKVDSCSVQPREVTARLLEEKLRRRDVPDIVIMRVSVTGKGDGKRVNYIYDMLDHYDRKRKVTSMARTTAYTASTITQLLAKKLITEKGVIPPEKLGMNAEVYRKFMRTMKEKGVTVKETRKIAR